MRHMSMPVLAIFLTMIVLTFGGCDKKPVLPTASATNAGTAASSVSATPVSVALPNFTALVKKEGPAVINISTVKKVRGQDE